MSDGYDTEKGAGWVAFAGAIVLIVGTMNVLGGIAAIDNAHFFTPEKEFVFGDLNTWGWIILSIGVLQLFAAFSIWAGGAYGRWIGVLTAGANSIAQLFFMAAFPLWSLALFSMDLLIIYGLIAYGGQRQTA